MIVLDKADFPKTFFPQWSSLFESLLGGQEEESCEEEEEEEEQC